MVTTRSQTKVKRATSVTSPVKEQKKAKIIILDTPTYSYKVGATNVKVYNCAADIIDAYDAYHKKTPVSEKQPQQQTTAATDAISSPIMTRSKSKKLEEQKTVELEEQKKVDTWKNIADITIEKIKEAPTAKDRRSFWTYTIKSLLDEQYSQKGKNRLENKAIITTEIYKILSYMYDKHFMDFTNYETFWRTTESKAKELLISLDECKKNNKITNGTYLAAKRAIQEAQTLQILSDNLVFPK